MVVHTKQGVRGTTAKIRDEGVIHSFFNKCGKNAIRGNPSPLEKTTSWLNRTRTYTSIGSDSGTRKNRDPVSFFSERQR